MEEKKEKKKKAKPAPSAGPQPGPEPAPAQNAVKGDEPKRKPKKKRPPPVDEVPGTKQAESGEEKPKKKKKKAEAANDSEGTFGTSPKTPSAPNDQPKTDADKEDARSVYEDALDTKQPYFGSNPMQEFRPPTRTGISELPVKDFFLLVLLWSPRFFVPWVIAWHEFNVFILADPDKYDAKENELLKVDVLVFAGACVVSIIASVIADLASMRYYVYLLLLVAYTLSPVAGGYVDVVFRSRFYDKELYNRWFSAIVMMRIALAIPFVFFPVQFACIFSEKDNMSRQAHYNWAAFFAFLEFVNAYAAFWVIPPKCPTTEWTQIAVWVLILALMYLLIVLTLIFSIIVKSMRYTLMICLRTFGLKPEKYLSEKYNEKIFKDRIPKNLRLKKLLWFGLVLIPLVFSSFVFATLERFVPDEDWDKHYVLSATSMFYLGRIVGVVVMVLTLFGIRQGFIKRILRIPIFRGDVLVLGLPHLFNIIALLILAVRYATLSKLSPGDVIQGPLPDDSQCVAVFINQMFRNKTLCVRSAYFRPVKVRAFHYQTREISDEGNVNINFSLIPEPGANPVVATNFVLHCQKNEWNIYTINLFTYHNTDDLRDETKYRENTNKPRVIRHYVKFRQNVPGREPSLIIINNLEENNLRTICCQIRWRNDPCGRPTIREMYDTHETLLTYWLSYETPHASDKKAYAAHDNYAAAYTTRLDRAGTWYAWLSYYGQDGVTEPYKFQADEYSVYVLSFFNIAPLLKEHTGEPDATIRQALLRLVRAKVHKIAEVAAPDGDRLPSKTVLQRDKAIQAGMFFAGMSAGGIFVGIVYLFWMDPPFPGWQATALAVFWTLMIGAAESPKVKLVDVGLIVCSVLLGVQILLTCLHVFASMKLYTPDFNFRKRPD